jgi:hypothetical protein
MSGTDVTRARLDPGYSAPFTYRQATQQIRREIHLERFERERERSLIFMMFF